PINNLVENLEVQATDTIIIESQREISPDRTNLLTSNDISFSSDRSPNEYAGLISGGGNDTIQKDNSHSYMSNRQNKQTLNSSSARNNSPEGFYSQQLLTSNDTTFFSDRSPNKYAGLISGGGNDILLFVILKYIVPTIINLFNLDMDNLHSHTSKRQNEQTLNSRSPSPENAHDRQSPSRGHSSKKYYDQQPSMSTTINTSALIGPFKNDLDFCLYLVKHPQLVELALNMMIADGGKKSITWKKMAKVANKFDTLFEKANQPTTRKIADYINKDNWTTFIKRHMDVIDIQKMFEEQHTVDMEVFTVDGEKALQQMNISGSFTTSDALSSASDTISSSDQSMVMSEIKLQESETECTQSIADSGINFPESTDQKIRVGRIMAIVSTSNSIKLKVQHLYFGSELPRTFTSSARIERSQNGELWLSEIIYLIDPFNVIRLVKFWLKDTPEILNYQFYVSFQNFTTDPLLQSILSDWYMIQNNQEKDTIDI
ncbi:10253_t:CDS:10, partial [Dentiscutata erythropus]